MKRGTNRFAIAKDGRRLAYASSESIAKGRILYSDFFDMNIGDPVAFSPREARFNILAFEAGRSLVKPRSVDILKCIDIDDRIEVILYFTRNERHSAAA